MKLTIDICTDNCASLLDKPLQRLADSWLSAAQVQHWGHKERIEEADDIRDYFFGAGENHVWTGGLALKF